MVNAVSAFSSVLVFHRVSVPETFSLYLSNHVILCVSCASLMLGWYRDLFCATPVHAFFGLMSQLTEVLVVIHLSSFESKYDEGKKSFKYGLSSQFEIL